MTTFDRDFEELTGSRPFPWQGRLYSRLVNGAIPSVCALPTGLGKTSVITIWHLARRVRPTLARRLVYVVNRRTVVDQTTAEVQMLREAERARGANDAVPFAISTLRGQMADNREWAADPSRPAVICGTVDMIGSRLLFSGYRIGFKTRPLHAAFLGQDALIVHDEAHLEPAFQALLLEIEAEQRRRKDPWQLSVMALSATARDERRQPHDAGRAPLVLEADDRAHPVVLQRITATKRLHLHECEDRELARTVVERVEALSTKATTIVVFLRTVEAVMKVAEKLGDRAVALTGTMRGHERDQLVERHPIFRRFLPPAPDAIGEPVASDAAAETAVLVATSAGEVGVNISADHMVCDLSTYESMAQRLGRVNRFGKCTGTEVHVLYPPEASLDDVIEKGKGDAPMALRRKRTLALLRELGGDASPLALDQLDPRRRTDAFAPAPTIRPASDILFDAWAMTTVREHPARPPVEEYLHGVATWEPPQTQVAWRREVEWLACDDGPGPSRDRRLSELEELLDEYPLKPHELLSDQTSRVVTGLLEAAGDPSLGDMPLWVIGRDQRLQVHFLGAKRNADRKQLERELAGGTLLLSPFRTQPVAGLLTSESWQDGTEDGEADVADLWLDDEGEPRRARVVDGEAPANMRRIRSIRLGAEADEQADDRDDVDEDVRVWCWYERSAGSDTDGPLDARRPVELEVHGRDVERAAASFVAELAMPEALRRAVIVAARLHDIGKARSIWQRAIGNRSAVLLAKGGLRVDSGDRTPYRHELGSLLDAATHAAFAEVPPELHDLVRHLIAAHHGRARPHFPERELLDPGSPAVDIAQVGLEVQRRFVALQRRYGRWGLAYLESLVRAADYAASAEPSAFVEGLS